MHPCCNGSLQNGTKNIAIFHLVLAIFIIISGVLAFAVGTAGGGAVTRSLVDEAVEKEGLTENFDSIRSQKAQKAKDIKLALNITSTLLLVAGVVALLQSLLLLIAASKRNRTMCMIWFILTALCQFFSLIATIRSFTSGQFDFTMHAFGSVGGLLLQSYFLWVVWAFMSELKEEAERAARASVARTPRVNTKTPNAV